MKVNDVADYFARALKEFRLRVGLSQEELALESDLDRTYISMLERGKKIPTILTLQKISRPLETTPAELLFRAQQIERSPTKKLPEEKKGKKIIFYGTSASCGKPLPGDFIPDEELSLDDLMIKKPLETFFIRANGDSMSPLIYDQDILIINKSVKPKNGSIILAQIDGDLTVKRFFKTSKGIKLCAENIHYKEIDINDADRLTVCGVITGTVRNL